MPAQTLHFGLLLLPEFQWLDAAGPVDFLNSHSKLYLEALHMDEALIARAPIMEWHFISNDLKPVNTGVFKGLAITPTDTYASVPALDYLLVPGPDPMVPLPEGCVAFLQRLIAQETFKALLTVCTGSIAVGQSGILDGLSVCGNKWVLRGLANAGLLSKNVKWVGDKRWTVDGKIWSAAGVTAGLDLAAEFARVHFDPEIVQLVKDLTEYEPNTAQPDPFAKLLEGINLS